MTGSGAIGSKLAAFESTIAKNREFDSEGERSFLTGVASSISPSRSSSKISSLSEFSGRRNNNSLASMLGKSVDVGDGENEEAVDYTVRWSPIKGPLSGRSTPLSSGMQMGMVDAVPFLGLDETSQHSASTAANSVSEASSATEATIDAPKKKKKMKKVLVRRRVKKGTRKNEQVSENEGVQQTLDAEHKTPRRPRNSQAHPSIKSPQMLFCTPHKPKPKNNIIDGTSKISDCSPTEASTAHESPLTYTESPLHTKISATLQKGSSGRALLDLAKTAAAKVANVEKVHPIKTVSEATYSSEITPPDQPIRRTYASSPHPNKKRLGYHDQSISSLPIVSSRQPEASFSSLPVFGIKQSTSIHPKRRYQRGARQLGPEKKDDDVSTDENNLMDYVPHSPTRRKIVFDNQKPRKQYPRSPMPGKAKLAANKLAAQLLNLDDNGSSTLNASQSDQVALDDVDKRKNVEQSRPNKPTHFHSGISLFTLDLESKPRQCPKTPAPDQDSIGGYEPAESPMSTTSFHHEPTKLIAQAEVCGILRKGILIRNTSRRVKFADQQPGGGRRMSLDIGNAKDCKPMQPRRSSMSDLDSLKHACAGRPSSLHVMTMAAATKVQAVARGWLQWRSTRVVLLEQKLVRMEIRRQQELAQIQEKKWKLMEKVRSEIVESEKRLESQVSLGDKLKEHLKRDTVSVKDQTKKLKEVSEILKRNNEQLDVSIRFQYDNFDMMKAAVDALQNKSATLLKQSNKLTRRIDGLNERLNNKSQEVEATFQDKRRTKRTIKRILSVIKSRSLDDGLVRLVSDLSQGRVNRTDSCNLTTDSDRGNKGLAPGFELKLKGHDNDEMSVFSDLTEFVGPSTSNTEGCSRKMSTESLDTTTSAGEESTVEYDVHRRNSNSASSCSFTNNSRRIPIERNSSGNSFAEYAPIKPRRSAGSRREAYAASRRESYRENGAKDIEVIAEVEDEDMSCINSAK